MPGLLRGIARTAVIAGTATTVSNRVSRRQYNRWSQQDEQQYAQQQQQQPQQPQQPVAAPPPVASAGDTRIEQLKQLGELKAQGILTEEEFAAEKARVLAA
jgi:hypothetical protein